MLHKIGFYSKIPWWTYWCWHVDTSFLSYKVHMGYNWISPFFPIVPKLNEHWDLISTKSQWTSWFCSVWSSFLEPKHVIFAYILMHQGLPFGAHLLYMGIPDPNVHSITFQSLAYTYFGSFQGPNKIRTRFFLFLPLFYLQLFLASSHSRGFCCFFHTFFYVW